MKLTRIVYGLTALQESDIFAGGDPQKDWPIDLAFFLVEGKGRRILVDCGCDTMPGFVLSAFIGPVKALRNRGVLPEQITDVILTHRHHDHAAGCATFPMPPCISSRRKRPGAKNTCCLPKRGWCLTGSLRWPRV